MPKRSSKQPTDPNKLAKSIVDQITSEEQPEQGVLTPEQQAARVLGRKGGLKGGRARAKSLSARQRREIAKKAARSRWKKLPR